MRRLLTLAGLAAAGAATYRRLRSGSSPGMTPAPTSTPTTSGSTPPTDEQTFRTPIVRPAPSDAPGPSVPAPVGDVAEASETLTPDPESLAETSTDPTEALVAREEAAAAAEAAAIGGRAPQDGGGDPEMDPVYQAGGGESEGFELAEQQLIENATHGGGRGNPIADAFTPEPEGELSGAAYGEADEEKVHEVTRDAEAEGEEADASEGPGITHEL